MGRILKRVASNFEWKIGELWSGYVNPHKRHECKECEGLGWSKEYNELKDKWYSGDNPQWKPNPFRPGSRYDSIAWNNNLEQQDVDALIEADRLWDFTRVPLNDEQREIVKKKIADGGNSWLPFDNGYKPTAQEVNEWNLKTMGHDSLNCSCVIKARLAKSGKSHLCSNCDGTGEKWQSEKAKELYENWEQYEPPTGDGFQLWSTTTEGHPMTPVFESLEKLCEYCEKEEVSVFGRETATKEEWMQMLDDGFVYHKVGNSIFM
jgi:hypothetical protein